MEYTLEGTAKATHYAYYENIQTEQFFDDSSVGNLKFMNNDNLPWSDCDYELSSVSHAVIVKLFRPYIETREYWTKDGETQYAQPQGNEMDTKVNENTNQAKLWKIIDDIDTFSDQIKPTELKGYKRYFEAVNGMVGKRFQVLESDGYNLFELGSMPESYNKAVAPSGSKPMNTDKLIPISYVKKFTPLVVNDDLISSIGRAYKVTSETLDHWNEIDNEDDKWFVVSFADRPNTGKNPVGDDVVVDCVPFSVKPYVEGTRPAIKFAVWNLNNFDSNVKSWKPNHAAMLKQYQTEQAKESISHDKMLDTLGEGIVKIKPVFTQAMADTGELPPVGSCFIVTNLEADSRLIDFLDLKVEVIGHCEFDKSETVVTFKHSIHGIGSGMYGKGYASWAKPIQTDEDKIRDAVMCEMDNLMSLNMRDDNYIVNDDTQVGAEAALDFLLDKFTFTLNSE